MNTQKLDELQKKFENHHYTNFVKNKKVIIVGPNTQLKGKELGKYIDSFDLVIRFNTVFDFLPLEKHLQRDYGSRTDILYWSPTCMKMYAHKSKSLSKLKTNQVKYLCYQNGNRDRKYMNQVEYCFPESLDWFKRHSKRSHITMHYSHHITQLITEMMNNLRSNPSTDPLILPRTGFIAIFDMIVHGAKSVETVGMSYENGGGHAFRPDAQKELSPIANHDGTLSPHDSSIEVKLVKLLIDSYPDKVKFA